MSIDPPHLYALALGIFIGALAVAAAWTSKRPDRIDPLDESVDLLEEWEREHLPKWRAALDNYRDDRDTILAHIRMLAGPEAEPRDTEDPQVPQCPRALPAPSTTDQLRLWTYDFEFIEELPLAVRLHDEGFIRLPIGSYAQRRINEALGKDELVWLNVVGPGGHWIGHCVRTHWSSERSGFCDFEFRAGPNWALPVWAGWRSE